MLLDLCRKTGFRVVNGRIGEDAGVGKCTYVGSRGSSLIDYVVADTELFKYFSNLCVEYPNMLFDHCVVKFMLTCCVSCKKVEESVSSCTYNMTQDTCVIHESNCRYVWDNNKPYDFMIKLQSEDVK